MTALDVLIIGGSISGSFTAYLLGKRGCNVTILEQHCGPKPKPCGEGLSILGKRYLETSGLWQNSIAAYARPFYGFGISFDGSKPLPLFSHAPIGYAIERKIIDRAVWNAALSIPTVSVVRGKAMTVTRSVDHWKVTTRAGDFYSKHVVLACGASGRRLIAEKPSPSDRIAALRYGIVIRARGVWRDRAPEHIMIENSRSSQLIITPLSNDRVNISILVTKTRGANATNSKRNLSTAALDFATRMGMRDIVIEESCATSLVGSSVAGEIENDLYLTGDTAEVMDPIGGMGMSHALISASLTASSIIRSLKQPRRRAINLKRYNLQRKSCTMLLRFATGFSYRLNVRRNTLLRRVALLSPTLYTRGLSVIENLVPVVGLAAQPGPAQIGTAIPTLQYQRGFKL